MTHSTKRLDVSHDAFLRHLPGKISDIADCWGKVFNNGRQTAILYDIQLLQSEVINASRQFGYKTLVNIMRKLENIARFSSGQTPHLPNAAEVSSINHLLSLAKKEAMLIRNVNLGEIYAGKTPPATPSSKRLCLLGDPLASQGINHQLSTFGYSIETCEGLKSLQQAIRKNSIEAVILDLDFARRYNIALPTELCTAQGTQFPVIAIASEDNLEMRLQAIRASADAFLVNPFQIEMLVDALSLASEQMSDEPYRVLLIEDTPFQAEYYYQLLSGAGMIVDVVTHPNQALERLDHFQPELILMDLYMPVCNGIELARVIRQYERYMSVPITFFSHEDDAKKQQTALSIGGDDFITKGVSDEYVVRAIVNRARRYRVLRSMMIKDGLTGLFNYSKIRDSLAQEIDRAERHHFEFSYALLDIDRLQQINEAHGHSVGDQVIKSLAQLLKHRLRGSDIIGRHGGEKFAALLLHTNRDYSIKVLEHLRQDFAAITHQADNKTFTASFSCGVANFPEFHTPQQLSDMAEQALARAKASGRNRICISSL